MLLTIEINNQLLPVIAPLGAAAYFIIANKGTASVVFGMMKPGEDGATALNRILDMKDSFDWRSVAARPEEQRPAPYCGSDFVSYEFVYADGRWTAATEQVASFINAMSNFQKMPSLPPKTMAYTFGPKKTPVVRAA